MPSLIGLTQAAAGQALGSAGLNVGNVTSVSSTQYRPDWWCPRTRARGPSVAPGSSVAIAVSSVRTAHHHHHDVHVDVHDDHVDHHHVDDPVARRPDAALAVGCATRAGRSGDGGQEVGQE